MKHNKINRFNIRVYGILIDDNKLLVTDEFRLGIKMTKFPGGAMKFGEGTIDCLKREFIEELGLHIDIISHFYTTDYFQQTKLLPETEQLISIYYLVKANEPYKFKTTDKRFDFKELIEGAQTFRWLDLYSLDINYFTLPIDKIVAALLIEKENSK
jgi:8-oxo-dGTP diphosphatase